MPEVVVVGGLVQCPHGGTQKLKNGSDKLKVNNSPAIVSGMEAPGLPFTPTPAPPDNPTPCSFATAAGPNPCTGLTPATGGVSTKLTIGGVGVLLSTASGGNTVGASPGPWTISNAGQTKLVVSG